MKLGFYIHLYLSIKWNFVNNRVVSHDIFDRCPTCETTFVCIFDGKKGPYCFDVFRSRDQYMISFFEERNARARERDRGVERVWQGGVESVGATFRPLGILSRIRGNSATNPWWPPADKYTAVKRYDILSLRELRRGSRGNVRARHEESVSTNDTLENHCAISHTLFIIITRGKVFAICTRRIEFKFYRPHIRLKKINWFQLLRNFLTVKQIINLTNKAAHCNYLHTLKYGVFARLITVPKRHAFEGMKYNKNSRQSH